jgi:hypothetical protein
VQAQADLFSGTDTGQRISLTGRRRLLDVDLPGARDHARFYLHLMCIRYRLRCVTTGSGTLHVEAMCQVREPRQQQRRDRGEPARDPGVRSLRYDARTQICARTHARTHARMHAHEDTQKHAHADIFLSPAFG